MPRRVSLVAILVIAAFVVSGCSDSNGRQGIRDADRSMFVEVPSDWTVYDGARLTEDLGTPFVTQQADFVMPVLSRVVFGQSADTSQLVAPSAATLPVGSATVRSISTAQRDLLSRLLISQAVVPYQRYPASQVFLNQDVEVADNYDGIQVIVAYNDPATGTDAAVSFVSVTDPTDTKLYTIAVGCTLECFGEYQSTINEIVDSWLVTTR